MVPGEFIIFSIIVKDVVAKQPDNVVTFTDTKIELVKGVTGLNSTEVSVEVAVTRLVKTSFIENSYTAPVIPPAVAVILNDSSSQIILLSLSDEIVAFGIGSIFTVTGLEIDEQAVGSGFPPSRTLL
jgi:hypothetical protein